MNSGTTFGSGNFLCERVSFSNGSTLIKIQYEKCVKLPGGGSGATLKSARSLAAGYVHFLPLAGRILMKSAGNLLPAEEGAFHGAHYIPAEGESKQPVSPLP